MALNENAQKWVAALRSGEFLQTKGRLRDGDAYCCLGVACELYRREYSGEYSGEWAQDREGGWWFLDKDLTLPSEVEDWLGLLDDGAFTDNHETYTLAELNDDGKTFEEIADIIESEPEGLFA